MSRKLAVSLVVLSSVLMFLAANSFGQTFSGSATAATASRPTGQTFGNVDLSGGPTSFIDLHWGYLDHTECGVNGASPCTFVSDPSLAYNAGYNQSSGAPGCLGVCMLPGVPHNTYEGEGPSGTNNVQLDGLGLPTLGTPTGIQTSVSHDISSSTSACALGYFASPFGPYNGIVNSSVGQTVPIDAMYQALDIRSTATAACTPSGGSVSFTFHHDYDKLGLSLPINPNTPQYFMQPVCFDLNSGLPPFNLIPLPTTSPTPGSVCFNQVLNQSTSATGASITVAAAVLTDTDGSTLSVCKTHADVENCGTTTPPPPTLACQSQGAGLIGTPYSSSLMASGGTPPYVMYSLLTGSLPNGLMLNSSTGEISGTPTTQGDFDFTAQVTDSGGQTGQTPASPSCHITVKTPPPPQIMLTKSASPNNVAPFQLVTFTYTVTNTGGTTLTGLVVTDDNGTPSDPSDDFTVGTIPSLAPGASATLTWTGYPPYQTVFVGGTGSPTPGGSLVIENVLNGTCTPNVNCNLKFIFNQSLGLNDNSYGTNSSPAWTAAGKTHKFTDLVGSDEAEWQFLDSTGKVVLDFQEDYITQASAPSASCPNTRFTSYGSGYGTLGWCGGDGKLITGNSAYIVSEDTTFTDDLNQSPAFYGFTTNSPPQGYPGWNFVDGYSVVINPAVFGSAGFGSVQIPAVHNSPSINGTDKPCNTPASGTSTNTGTVTAAGGVTATAQATVTITSNLQCSSTTKAPPPPPKLTITVPGGPAANGTVNKAYNITVTAKGGTPAYSFSISAGSLPPGLTLNSSSGAITGLPTTAGKYTFTVKVTDSAGATATAPGTINIAAH